MRRGVRWRQPGTGSRGPGPCPQQATPPAAWPPPPISTRGRRGRLHQRAGRVLLGRWQQHRGRPSNHRRVGAPARGDAAICLCCAATVPRSTSACAAPRLCRAARASAASAKQLSGRAAAAAAAGWAARSGSRRAPSAAGPCGPTAGKEARGRPGRRRPGRRRADHGALRRARPRGPRRPVFRRSAAPGPGRLAPLCAGARGRRGAHRLRHRLGPDARHQPARLRRARRDGGARTAVTAAGGCRLQEQRLADGASVRGAGELGLTVAGSAVLGDRAGGRAGGRVGRAPSDGAGGGGSALLLGRCVRARTGGNASVRVALS